MLIDREILARSRRETLVFFGVLLAALLLLSVGTGLIIASAAWQSRLDTLVATGESRFAIVLHMAIAGLPVLPFLILLPMVLRRGEIRCGHCARRLGRVAISTGICGGCGRPAVVLTGAGRSPTQAHAAGLSEHPTSLHRGEGADSAGLTATSDAEPALTAAELNAAVRRALPPAFAGIAAMVIVMVLGTVFLRPGEQWGTCLLILMTAIALMLTGCVIADRHVPRCTSCRMSLAPTWFAITTGRCRGCGTRVVRMPPVPLDVDATSRIDRDCLNRAADLYRRVGLLPCGLGLVVGLGLIALLWNGPDGPRWWAGPVALLAMFASIVAGPPLLRRVIDRRVAGGNGACASCRASLFAAFRDGVDAVGATGRCWRCGVKVMECPEPDSRPT